MIDVGFDLCGGWRWHWGQNLLSFCVEVIGQLVGSLGGLLVLQPVDGAELIHGGSRRVV